MRTSFRHFMVGACCLHVLAGAADFRVLFVGNSFTQGSPVPGGVPELFDRLARAGGQGDPDTVMSAAGGSDFRYHTSDATTRANISGQPWTHVILQNYSTEPTHLVDGTHSLSNHFTYGARLYDLVMSNSPHTEVVLYETWSRASVHPLITGTSNASGYASTAAFQAELRANYQRLADLLNDAHPGHPPVLVAPVGDAWEEAGGLRDPADPLFVSLHGNDDYHGNASGYYLAAAVFYSRIFGVSPHGLSSHPLIASLALPFTESPTVLEDVAWGTVTNSGAGPGSLVFLREPQDQRVTEFQPVTLSATVSGRPPFFSQWWSNGVPIPGAEALVLHLPSASIELNGVKFAVTVSNLLTHVTSRQALLTVVPDTQAPSLLAVTTTDGRRVALVFSERLDEVGVGDLTGYTVTGASTGEAPVTTAVLEPDGRTVLLTLGARISGPFTVTVRQLRDLAGLEVSAGTTLEGMAPVVGPQTILVDFGSASTTTEHGPAPEDPVRHWNNVAEVGVTTGGQLAGLVTADNAPTGIGLVMLSRFNGANANGTLAGSPFPQEATRDSLFGNTEVFSGLSGIFPSFKLTGLDPALVYDLTFYASRTGVGDNRETLYSVVGALTNTVTLNAANNVTNTARLAGVLPAGSGELVVRLTPGPRNNNANHFTYLGVLRLDLALPRFTAIALEAGQVRLDWSGAGQLEWAPSALGPWTSLSPSPSPPHLEPLVQGGVRCYRLRLGP